MRRQPSEGTRPELALRRELHRNGLRYRLHTRPLPGVRHAADIVFRPARVAVDVHGCFWHNCPLHGSLPKTNTGWWSAKLDRNTARDRRVRAELERNGWVLIEVWEHEDPAVAAASVASTVRARRAEATDRPTRSA